jgi:hypothetical protein
MSEAQEAWRLVYLSAPEGESEPEFWHRKFTESLVAICTGRTENDKLQADNDKLRWMLDRFMHKRNRYMEFRAGYADVFNLVKQDLEEDYEATRCPSCGGETDHEDEDTPCLSCRTEAAEHAMEGER